MSERINFNGRAVRAQGASGSLQTPEQGSPRSPALERLAGIAVEIMAGKTRREALDIQLLIPTSAAERAAQLLQEKVLAGGELTQEEVDSLVENIVRARRADIMEILDELKIVEQASQTAKGSALFNALAEHQYSIAEILVNNGAKNNYALLCSYPDPPSESKELAHLVIEKGAIDPNSLVPLMPQRAPQLHIAAASRDVKGIELLLERGADVNAEDVVPESALTLNLPGTYRGGRTALHIAAEAGNEEMVAFLIRRGANPNARDKTGISAADLARKKGHDNIAEIL